MNFLNTFDYNLTRFQLQLIDWLKSICFFFFKWNFWSLLIKKLLEKLHTIKCLCFFLVLLIKCIFQSNFRKLSKHWFVFTKRKITKKIGKTGKTGKIYVKKIWIKYHIYLLLSCLKYNLTIMWKFLPFFGIFFGFFRVFLQKMIEFSLQFFVSFWFLALVFVCCCCCCY